MALASGALIFRATLWIEAESKTKAQ
jgi:hypothetical protein